MEHYCANYGEAVTLCCEMEVGGGYGCAIDASAECWQCSEQDDCISAFSEDCLLRLYSLQ